jgi:phage gp36-like protein
VAYCTTADINLRFGAQNVLKWADLEGVGSSGDQTNVNARLAEAITQAGTEIDMALRGGRWTVPVVPDPISPVGAFMRRLSTDLAGAYLYEARGFLDNDDQGNKMTALQKHNRDQLAAIRSGAIRLDTSKWAPNPQGPACI